MSGVWGTSVHLLHSVILVAVDVEIALSAGAMLFVFVITPSQCFDTTMHTLDRTCIGQLQHNLIKDAILSLVLEQVLPLFELALIFVTSSSITRALLCRP